MLPDVILWQMTGISIHFYFPWMFTLVAQLATARGFKARNGPGRIRLKLIFIKNIIKGDIFQFIILAKY